MSSLRSALSNRVVMSVVAGINAVSFAVGILWYWRHLMGTPAYLWPVVPDCPLAALFVAAALWMRVRGKPSRPLDALAWASALKYGIWTVAILSHARTLGAATDPLSAILLWSHVGMIIEAMAYGALYPPGRYALLVPAGWFLLNDFSDYVLNTHPSLPLASQYPLAVALAVATTLGALAFLVIANRKARSLRLRGGADMRTATFSVPDMACEGCASTVRTAAGALPGVSIVNVDLADKLVRVDFDDAQASADQIARAISEAGYEATLREE
ncbi:MAG: copper ion binding protein [Bacillota bacterium]